MKNVQVIDGGVNAVYDIFQFSDEQFRIVFPEGTDIAFIDEVSDRESEKDFDRAFQGVWDRRIKKTDAVGIHGTLFYENEHKKPFYPTRKDEEARNPDGTHLRRP